ncbi:MAG: hypothetical protein NC120_07180 [Ruminococcus sp.]|nr:hypothetical protein [Ruminococcus sp.]
MARIKWDETGKRDFEMGVSQNVLYPFGQKEQKYKTGVPWNGLINVHESPEGAEATDLWADNIKYASFRSAEDFKGSIEAYTYPDEFDECNGYREAAPGMKVAQQGRTPFGLSYRTGLGSDTDPDCTDYKLHIVYGATVSPSEKEYQTVNDSPDAATFSWDFETVPVDPEIEGFKPTAHLEINSRTTNKDALKKLEDILYGTDTNEARLPMPKEIAELLKSNASGENTVQAVSENTKSK